MTVAHKGVGTDTFDPGRHAVSRPGFAQAAVEISLAMASTMGFRPSAQDSVKRMVDREVALGPQGPGAGRSASDLSEHVVALPAKPSALLPKDWPQYPADQ
jgi:hypothetical protein